MCPLVCCLPTQVVGQLLAVAQDQNGCRFLQRKFDEGGASAIAIVFTEVRPLSSCRGRRLFREAG